jgi:hypothetical protein
LYTTSTGSQNVAIGDNTLHDMGISNGNIAIGSSAMQYATGGGNNTAIGTAALLVNAASDNVGIGYNALGGNELGAGNTAVGNSSMNSNSGGSNNTAIGLDSLGNTNSSQNTAIGAGSLSQVTSGANNTGIGYQAGACGGNNNIITGSNNTLIGYNAQSPVANPANNMIVLGNSDITTIYCQQTTITPLSSDARDKTEVETIPLGLEFINQLRPVKYKYDSRDRYENGVPDGSKADDFWTTGFIAQEVLAVQPEWFKMAVELGEDRLTATPGMVLMPLLKAVQELSAQVTALQAQVNSLTKLQ